MRRRSFLLASIGGATAVAAPRLARGQDRNVLRFVPQADLAMLDPTVSTPTVTRNHAFLVYDTLYGLDDSYQPQPQMLAGHHVEQDGKLWRLVLRDGLRFHDGEPVRARDVVASIRRWAAVDGFGQALLAVTDELSANGDGEIRFRLKRPFPKLPDALGKIQPRVLAIMPERLALMDPNKPVPEIIGSGPFRFLAAEQVAGSRFAYARFDGYVPREDGPVGLTSGPKRAMIDRVEWHIIPDAATAAAALQSGEVDWWEQPDPDLLGMLRKARNVAVELKDHGGSVPLLAMNCLQPPFNNPAIRRAVLSAIDRRDIMRAVAGTDRSGWNERIGIFTPGSPLANDAGLDRFDGPRDLDAAKRQILAAGYNGEKVVLLSSSDILMNNLSAEVIADVMTKIGLKVDLQVLEWGAVTQRRASRAPVDHGGWSAFTVRFDGVTLLNPAVALIMGGNGLKNWYGWSTSPRLEELCAAWLAASDLAAEQAVARDIQSQFWQDAPDFPLGQVLLPYAYSRRLSGILDGFPKFYNVTKT
jgi:peptide/nickel transport system substrate-binding protein